MAAAVSHSEAQLGSLIADAIFRSGRFSAHQEGVVNVDGGDRHGGVAAVVVDQHGVDVIAHQSACRGRRVCRGGSTGNGNSVLEPLVGRQIFVAAALLNGEGQLGSLCTDAVVRVGHGCAHCERVINVDGGDFHHRVFAAIIVDFDEVVVVAHHVDGGGGRV